MLVGEDILQAINDGTLVPMNNQIIIKRDGENDENVSGTSKGGILLPGIAYKADDWGTVVAVPKAIVDKQGNRRDPSLKVGDRVFTRPSDGDKFLPLHKNFQFVRYERVEAVEVDGKIVPFEKRVLVEKLATEQKTTGGLLLPDSSEFTVRGKKVPRSGRSKVLAVGPQVEGISIGDVVLTDRNDGCEIEVDEIECLTIEIQDIIGVE